MIRPITNGLFATALALAAGQACAQDGWNFAASFYIFGAETTTKQETGTAIGEIESTLSFKDAMEDLDVAAMAAFEARNGPWGLLFDYMLTDISMSESTPGPLFSGADIDVRTQVFSGTLLYRVYRAPALSFDLGGGFRWYSTDSGLELKPGAAARRKIDFDDDWTDPVVAARLRFRLQERWGGTVSADYGGFSDDSESYQILLSLDYALSDRWLIRGGYRYLDIDHEIDGNDYSFVQKGPLFGATYRF